MQQVQRRDRQEQAGSPSEGRDVHVLAISRMDAVNKDYEQRETFIHREYEQQPIEHPCRCRMYSDKRVMKDCDIQTEERMEKCDHREA